MCCAAHRNESWEAILELWQLANHRLGSSLRNCSPAVPIEVLLSVVHALTDLGNPMPVVACCRFLNALSSMQTQKARVDIAEVALLCSAGGKTCDFFHWVDDTPQARKVAAAVAAVGEGDASDFV